MSKLDFNPELQHMINNGVLNDDVNCFAATLLFFKIIDEPEWTDHESIYNFITNECEEIFYPSKPNDIMIVWDYALSKPEIDHSAIFVDGDNYWHKPGMDECTYATSDEIIDQYFKGINRIKYYRIKNKEPKSA